VKDYVKLRNAEWDFNLSRDWFLERFGLNVETAWFQLESLRFVLLWMCVLKNLLAIRFWILFDYNWAAVSLILG
jgi:hypothetical protein